MNYDEILEMLEENYVDTEKLLLFFVNFYGTQIINNKEFQEFLLEELDPSNY